MKFFLVCVLALAVQSEAAFTSRLVKDTQPVLAQGLFKLRLASRNNAAQTELATIIQTRANDVLGQLQGVISAGQQIAEIVHAHLAGTIAEIQALEPGRVAVTTVVAVVGGVISALAQLPAAIDTVVSAWHWLFGRNLGFLGNIVDAISNFSVTDVLNSLAGYATSLINQLDLGSLLQYGLEQVLPPSIANLITGQLGLTRGIFGDLSSAAAGVWGQVSAAAGSLYEAAAQSFAQLQQLATQLATDAWTETGAITNNAAQQLLAFLKPYQQDLGALYEQVAAQITQVLGN